MINPFKKKYSAEEKNVFVFLSSMPLFEKLSNKEMSEFIPYMHERVFHQNEVVFLRDDPSHALYLLKSGEVAMSIEVNDNLEELTRLNTVQSFGESCLLEDTKRQLNAIVTSEEAHFYVIPQMNILEIFKHNLKLKIKMQESLSRIYHNYNVKLFKTYKSTMGFFELKDMYTDIKK